MKFLICLILTFPLFSMAHEDHDHDSPKKLEAPKGGLMKSLEEAVIEVVSKGENLTIYIYDHDLKPKKTAGFIINAQAELPRSKNLESISLKDNGTEVTGQYKPKKVHRYTLILTVKQPNEDHADKLKFTIEPHK